MPGFRPPVLALPLLVIVLLAGLLPVPSAAGAALGERPVFGLSGRLFTNFRPIPKWQRLLERYRVEEAKDARCRRGGAGNCPYREWRALIERLRGRDRLTQVEEVNRFANRWRYIEDRVNWGVADYWATPGEFFERAGDCEDYAIVKFMSLRALGFRNDDLLLVAVKDQNLGVGHAVALVSVRGRTLLLDNQIKQVVEADRVRHYQPVYAANEEVWWLYRPR
ncbi:transglutaminase-like cysteine peptidase [Marichromatium bheemlicum]|uniref:Transglutaminase-like cysteine proteinase BTLCP n=1 Tax=Marichromatium bheemlicum TaxID=365339 RepID=A0ABX1IAK5_9GAMM|nr:transglutaminase-like cysteine peptidase [Marichromatium bheemlicum]NKN34567.1 hypothetical protein [Marichromatium bheemlicum]